MPIEFERKLLLQTSSSKDLLKDLKAVPNVEWLDITQAYVNNSSRIRHVVPHCSTQLEKWLFTFKTKVRGSTVEIETEISTHDYSKLFLISRPVIIKTRAKIICNAYTWDIDFFRKPKSGDIYLAMAEVEMPEFERDLPDIHSSLAPYAVTWIDQGDKRFNNRNLANPKKTARSVAEVINATKATT
jgi:CYTH domain-containing protein